MSWNDDLRIVENKFKRALTSNEMRTSNICAEMDRAFVTRKTATVHRKMSTLTDLEMKACVKPIIKFYAHASRVHGEIFDY